MPRRLTIPALVAHGGAGAAGPATERVERRRAILAATRAGADILRHGGSAIDAVVATVVALEDHPLFNAGYGSLLNSEGHVEMDASVMAAEPAEPASIKIKEKPRTKHSRHSNHDTDYAVTAGAVAAVSRVR